MANKSVFDFEMGVMQGRIEELDGKLDLATKAAFQEVALFADGYMKSTAPWTDRTGAARAGLHTNTQFAGHRYEIILAHAVSYGIWLEVANNGRYQVIMPSVKVATDRLAHHLQGMMGDLK